MVKRIHIFLLAALLSFGVAQNSQAELFAVSATSPTDPAGVFFPGSQYPLWYQDFAGPTPSGDFNPNYGIGPTAGGLKLELCPGTMPLFCLSEPPVGPPPALQVGAESFWWTSDASVPVPAGGALVRPGQVLLVLALEGAFPTETPVAGQELSFGRVRILIDAPVGGTYTVTHPFGVQVFNVDTPGIRAVFSTDDFGSFVTPADFRVALGSNVGPFLFPETPNFAALTDGAGNFFIGNIAETPVLGSPLGTNFFRVDGPPGSNLGGPGIDFVETNLFAVTGKVFTGAGNTPPVAVADAAVTRATTPVVINVLGNDTFTDIPIHPGSLAIATTPAGGTAAKTIVDGQVRVTYTPNAGFTGDDTFTYMIQNFAGTAALAAGTVTVTVEDLKVNKAEFRPKFLKWRVSGTSSDTTANAIGIQSGPPTVNTTLSGANELPTPVVSPGSGSATVTVGENSISFTLNINGLLNVTSTHLHLGSTGENGPVLFTLAGPNATTISNGTLTAADLQPQPAQGINTFVDAANAILGGKVYVQVHTAAVPAGELRGQLGPNRLVGSPAVQADGTWAVDGKSDAFPDAAKTISVRSSNGVRVIDVPLKVK